MEKYYYRFDNMEPIHFLNTGGKTFYDRFKDESNIRNSGKN